MDYDDIYEELLKECEKDNNLIIPTIKNNDLIEFYDIEYDPSMPQMIGKVFLKDNRLQYKIILSINNFNLGYVDLVNTITGWRIKKL